jgi:hypothetical protein
MENSKAKYKQTPEEKAESKQRREWDREERKRLKLEKEESRKNKIAIKTELAILRFMLKTDVLYYHHGKQDSMKSVIKTTIQEIKETEQIKEYNGYVWNYLGEGNNYLPKCQLGNLFSSDEFETIYDVPLDGSYIFSIFDSGQRGLGSFNYIRVTKTENEIIVPYVNPGAFPPITINK